jgi:hypothetical protein
MRPMAGLAIPKQTFNLNEPSRFELRRGASLGAGDLMAELIDTIEGCGDVAFRQIGRQRQRSPSVEDLAPLDMLIQLQL